MQLVRQPLEGVSTLPLRSAPSAERRQRRGQLRVVPMAMPAFTLRASRRVGACESARLARLVIQTTKRFSFGKEHALQGAERTLRGSAMTPRELRVRSGSGRSLGQWRGALSVSGTEKTEMGCVSQNWQGLVHLLGFFCCERSLRCKVLEIVSSGDKNPEICARLPRLTKSVLVRDVSMLTLGGRAARAPTPASLAALCRGVQNDALRTHDTSPPDSAAFVRCVPPAE